MRRTKRLILGLSLSALVAFAGVIHAATPAGSETLASPPLNASDIPTITPVELSVPAAGIDASVQTVGYADDGSMDVPTNFTDVAWFSPGYEPGEFGYAVFDGHVSNVDSAAVFFYVEDLEPGANVYVTGADGTVLTFQVSDVESYPLDSAPLDSIFGASDWPGVALITCSGDWHEDVHLFDHRTVAYSSLIAVSTP